MAKKGKAKISKVKRNNQTTNKMKKQGKLRLQRHREKIQKQKQPQQPPVSYSSDSDSPSEEEWADMLDEEEKEYILKQSNFLSHIPEIEQPTKSSIKRKKTDKGKMPRQKATASDSGADSNSESDSDVEEKYEQEMAERPAKRMRPLLPIKTKEGLLEREEECEDEESESEENKTESKLDMSDKVEADSDSDSGMEATDDVESPGADEGVVSTVQLLAARRDKLQHDKLRIGALCSSLLECPDKKLKNLYPILYLMEERLKDGALNLLSVRKLAMLSTYEVFKDILPEYYIRHQDYSNVKLKKDTLALYKFEKELLEFYKRYLQKLEKATNILRSKKGDTRKPDESTIGLAIVALRCMAGMLVARPHFNYATNIAQSVIPFLDSRETRARDIVTEACVEVFKDDNKGDITLTIVRLINQLIKKRGERLHPSALDCLMSLKIRDIDLDQEAEVKNKKKQEEKHKKRIVNLSKKEKKRAKKLKEVEHELLETEAQENEMARRKQLTEVTKTVFHIYFRLLKTAPRSNLLAAALNGLAKFTHVINLEFYSDLLTILSQLINDELVTPRSRLLCVRTALAVASGAGDVLNVDPARFNTYLYNSALDVHAGSTSEDAKVIIEAISQVCSRARRVSANVLVALAKRLLTISLNLPHNAALACLALVHQMAQHNKSVAVLFEPDSECGSGRYDPLLQSPEHCNASAAAGFELATLRRHYHSTVKAAATAVPRDTWVSELGKLTPMNIYEAYDGSQMAFKPPIPPPKTTDSQKVKISHTWIQKPFKEECDKIENSLELMFKDSIVTVR